MRVLCDKGRQEIGRLQYYWVHPREPAGWFGMPIFSGMTDNRGLIMKKIMFFILVFSLPGLARADEKVYFADANLKAAVVEQLKIVFPGITDPNAAEMLELTELNPWAAGITDLTGIEYALNLNTLQLDINQISDITPLAGLTQLTVLFLNDNLISDPNALAGLTNLKELYLNDNQISDILPLSSLIDLEKLYLNYNQISDPNALAGLTKLTELHLSNNLLGNIEVAAQLTDLTELHLNFNQISDITALKDPNKLTRLGLNNNQITDIEPLEHLSLLTILQMNNNHIEDISPLAQLMNLGEIYFLNNPLNAAAYCDYLPLIRDHNPAISINVDSQPLFDNGSCDLIDLSVLAFYWLRNDCGPDNNWCDGADFDHSQTVDLVDFWNVSYCWMKNLQ